jgi:tetratricopeptide (TPR) repeat protein
MTWRSLVIPLTLGVGLGLAGPLPAGLGGDPDDIVDGSVRRAPYDPATVRKTVEFWEGRVRKSPDRFLEQRELAGAYLARQRETGDVQDAVRAERAARRSLELLPRGNATALTRLARSLLGQHRFPEALEAARRAAALDPAASLLVADVELELGHDKEARGAFAEAGVAPDHPSALVLRARFAQADGDLDGALRCLRQAAGQADELTDLPAEAAAWFHVMVGHALIDRGRLDEGTVACRSALAIFPRDYRAMTGLAEAAAWRGEWDEVVAWGCRAVEASPQDPEALALLAEAFAKLGRKEEAERRIRQLNELAHSFPRIYDRHWALFCGDNDRNLDEALNLARKDIELRQDAGAYDTLAWAAFKKGLAAEADAALRKALEHPPQTAPFFRRAEAIARAAGRPAEADAFRARARELNPYVLKATPSSKAAAAE